MGSRIPLHAGAAQWVLIHIQTSSGLSQRNERISNFLPNVAFTTVSLSAELGQPSWASGLSVGSSYAGVLCTTASHHALATTSPDAFR